MTGNNRTPNQLIHESSPYLLQHALNPVNWYSWNEEAWQRAKAENKLVLVSIGYSSCHWCHVMEHESFEDEETAKLMNDLYICIKVDREERPDVDQVYMSAVQLMTGHGGWPLNCFCLPDGRPLHGGTYFPNAKWNEVLVKLAAYYRQNQKEAESFAGELVKGIHQVDLFRADQRDEKFSLQQAEQSVEAWKKLFDTLEGGPNRAPKFPLPNNYEFLLQYAWLSNDKEVLS